MKKLTLNEYGEQVVTMEKSDRGPLTEEEKQMIADLDTFEDMYDEECPPIPAEMAEQMKKDINSGTRKGRLAAIG
jgi:hypothetical protein